MDANQHAWCAKQLVDAVRGVKMAEHLTRRRKTQIYKWLRADSGVTMPADAIFALQAAAKTRLYTDALAASAPDTLVADVVEATLDCTEAAADLQQDMRKAVRDSRLSPREKTRLIGDAKAVEMQARRVQLAVEAAA